MLLISKVFEIVTFFPIRWKNSKHIGDDNLDCT